MHFQTTVQNWTNALVKMPDGALLKSVNDPAILVDGMAKWSAAGRDTRKLWTDFRYHDLYYPQFDAVAYTWEELKITWRANFRRFIDATYLRNYAPHIKLIEELNEYTDSRMITDKALLAPRLLSAQAAVWVWNNEYRGRVREVDGVEGLIPADCRLVICNSPVGNDVPKEYYQLSVSEDAPLGVHPYTHWQHNERDPQDFRYHSGRWHYNEQAYGIKPTYVFTECSLYDGVLEGWRHQNVVNGNRDLLLFGMTAWWQDCQQTAAYKEGRILGPGAWFTSSTSNDQWSYYKLYESELTPLADLARQIWKPGNTPQPPPPPPPPPVDDLAQALWIVSLENQIMSYNPDAALQKVIFAHGFVPVSNEYRQEHNFTQNAAQAAEHLGTGGRRVNYTEVGNWGNVRYITGNSSGLSNSSDFAFEAWPTDSKFITQPFGARPDYYRQFYGDDRGHQGIDIAAPLGTYIMAVAPGKVIRVSDKKSDGSPSNLGWHIVIEHAGGWQTLYAHLEIVTLVEVGDFVLADESIGFSGNTGNSSGPHLHLTLRGPDGDIVDPKPYLEAIS